MSPAPKRFPGVFVKAYVTLILSKVECKRKFGSNWKTKVLPGTTMYSEGVPKGRLNRLYTYITALYEMDSISRNIKVVKLLSQSV